jgi:hypothetical protein
MRKKVGIMPSNRSDALLAEYREVSNNFRMLTDIRFKLLAFLPVAAAAATAVLARGNATTLTLAFSLFGLVVTIGLVTYNARNDQLYDTLVARAAAIERYLGIPDGAFANRPRSWFQLVHGGWKVDHRPAVATIYMASIALWLFGALHAAIDLAQPTLTRWISPTWANLIALAAAVGLTILGGWFAKHEKKRADECLRKTAAEAVKLAGKLLGESEESRSLCEELAGAEAATGKMRERFLLLCAKLAGTKADKTDVVQARACFLSKLPPDAIADYVTEGSAERTAAQIVAVITDLAPEWLYDCATNRRGPIPAGGHSEASCVPS